MASTVLATLRGDADANRPHRSRTTTIRPSDLMMQYPLTRSLRSGRWRLLVAKLLGSASRRASANRFQSYRPYAKQAAFHAAGLAHRERLFLAGNQLGKTVAGAFEEAIHPTGRYPDWWRGRRFTRPTG